MAVLTGKGDRCDINDKGLGYWVFVGSKEKGSWPNTEWRGITKYPYRTWIRREKKENDGATNMIKNPVQTFREKAGCVVT